MLELGTGTSISTAWILDGMDNAATLLSVDSNEHYFRIAQRHLGPDPRLRLHLGDGTTFLSNLHGHRFDLIFADTWPGKFDHLEAALELLAVGGLYVIDDLLPQANWPSGHAVRVPKLISQLEHDPRLVLCRLAWSSGMIVAARRG